MFQEQRFAAALAVSLAAHAAAGLSLPDQWWAAEVQIGPPSAPNLAATLIAEERSDSAQRSAKAKPAQSSEPATLPTLPAPAASAATGRLPPTPSEAQTAPAQPASSDAGSVLQRPSANTRPAGPGHAREPGALSQSAPQEQPGSKLLRSQPNTQTGSRRDTTPPDQPLAPVPVGDNAPPPSASASVPSRQAAGTEADPYWRDLAAWLERHKRYPRVARDRRQQGIVHINFVMDRDGHVLSHKLLSSSGHPALDQEAAQLLSRAAPLPAAPPSIPGQQLEISIPIHFRLP